MILLCAFASHKYEILLLAALAGLISGAGNRLQQTILQTETLATIAGLVFTTLTAIHFIIGPFGLLLAGLLTEFTSIETALLSAEGLMLALAIFDWFCYPLQKLKEYSDDQT